MTFSWGHSPPASSLIYLKPPPPSHPQVSYMVTFCTDAVKLGTQAAKTLAERHLAALFVEALVEAGLLQVRVPVLHSDFSVFLRASCWRALPFTYKTSHTLCITSLHPPPHTQTHTTHTNLQVVADLLSFEAPEFDYVTDKLLSLKNDVVHVSRVSRGPMHAIYVQSRSG